MFFSISIILKKLNKYRPTTVVIPVFLALGGILVNFAVLDNLSKDSSLRANTVFGGPKVFAQINNANLNIGLEADNAIETLTAVGQDEGVLAYHSEDSASVINSSAPLSNLLPSREGILIYKVQKGDTLLKIAHDFEISLNTILWANPKLKVNLINPGQEILILPVTGIVHQVRDGETLDSIADLYGVSRENILQVNPVISQSLSFGDKIIIPDAKPKTTIAYSSKTLPNLSGYFAVPTAGRNWGQLHAKNAVDIANKCGTPVYSSAEGLITETGGQNLWNGGLGGYVEIEHPNRTGTLYAHLQSLAVSIGDYIEKGEKIGEMGNSGNVKGNTGCHLHFEVRGARNPLAN